MYNLYDKTIETNIVDFSECLLDDLNTPGFIAKIHELYNSANKGNIKNKNLFNSACRLLGLFNIDKNSWNNIKKTNTDISESFILKKLEDRNIAKKEGNYSLADKIREELSNKGVLIEDLKGKTNWKYK